MDEPVEKKIPVRWIVYSVLFTAFNVFWSGNLHTEDARRKGAQRVFGPSPPLLPEWYYYTVHAFLLFQLILSAIWVWKAPSGRWALAAFLLGLWLFVVIFSGL